MRELKPCGTHAAYTRHKRRGEPVDALCAQAARAQRTNQRHEAQADLSKVIRLAIADAPPIENIDELEEARDNLRIVKATMYAGPPSGIAALSTRYSELVTLIHRLERGQNSQGSALDQLAQRRAERLARNR